MNTSLSEGVGGPGSTPLTPGSAGAGTLLLDHDAHFTNYMNLYIHLDTILWQAVAFLGAVVAFGFGFLGNTMGGTAALWPLTHDSTIGLGLLAMATLLWLGSRSLERIREDTKVLAAKMREMEGDGFYLDYRSKHLSKGPSATVLYCWAFRGVSVVLGALAILQFSAR